MALLVYSNWITYYLLLCNIIPTIPAAMTKHMFAQRSESIIEANNKRHTTQ